MAVHPDEQVYPAAHIIGGSQASSVEVQILYVVEMDPMGAAVGSDPWWAFP